MNPAASGKVSGMVIGPSSFLTPGDIAPDALRAGTGLHQLLPPRPSRGWPRRSTAWARAANLGEGVHRHGRARHHRRRLGGGRPGAGQAFAATFYRNMLAGETFGEAAHRPRGMSRLRFPT